MEDVKLQEMIKHYRKKHFVPVLLFPPLVTLAQTFFPQILTYVPWNFME